MAGPRHLLDHPRSAGRPGRLAATAAVAVTSAALLAGVTAGPLGGSTPSQGSPPPANAPQTPPAPPAPASPLPRPDLVTSQDGVQFFYSRDTSPSKIACADCHVIQKPGTRPADDLLRPGHNLYDAFGRGTWWNARVMTDCGEAAEACFKRFMGGVEFDFKTRTGLTLFMKSRSAPASNPWVLLRVPPGHAEVNRGDAERGREVFRRACSLCHASGGGPRGPDLATSKMTPREISDVVREGKDRMPFFQMDILTDDQVADVSVYAWSLQPKSE